MSEFYDGAWTTAQQDGPDVYSVDDDTKSLIVTRKMKILAANWTALARGTSGPTVDGTATKLLSESEPRHIGGGVVEWERIFGAKPADRDEWEDYVATYQNIAPQDGPPKSIILLGSTSLATFPVVTRSRVEYKYYDAAVTAPSAIPIKRPFEVTEAGGAIWFLGTSDDIPNESDTEMVAEGSTIRRWRNSNFYERVTRYVPLIPLSEP